MSTDGVSMCQGGLGGYVSSGKCLGIDSLNTISGENFWVPQTRCWPINFLWNGGNWSGSAPEELGYVAYKIVLIIKWIHEIE